MKRAIIDHSELLFKTLSKDSKLIHQVFDSNGFRHTDSMTEWNVLWTSKHSKNYTFEGLHESQKINVFPRMDEITRKDKLCKNINRMQKKFGKENFDFFPTTYILPDNFADFQTHFLRLREKDQKKNLWILKPANSS